MIAAYVVDLVSTVAELEKLAPAHFRLSLPIFISSTVNSGAGAPCGRAHPRVIKSEGRSK